MNFFRNQKGNVFFALFGAVAFVGVLGAATMSFMKGPLKTSVTLSRMSVAETQMQVASQMGVLQASTESDSGDCDSDGFVEPIEFKVQATAALKPVGGGNIPDTLGASKTDPWGQLYGYCVWNSGTNVDVYPGGASNVACDDDGDGTEQRIEGSPNNYDVVMAVISAGPDRTFATTCQTFDAADANDNLVLGDVGDTEMIFKTGGSDDIILSYTYAEAATVGGGGLWSLKSSDPGTATIDKAIEFTGGLTMGTEIDVTICSLSTVNQMRYNGVTDVIQVCDGSSWVDMSGGATPAGNPTEIQFNTAGALDADTGLTYNSTDDELTIDGSVTLGATADADMPVLISSPTIDLSTVLQVFEEDSGVVRNTGDHSTEDFVFGSTQLDDTGNADHDSRMFFDKSKSAFRAGIATGTNFDDVNVGNGSIGLGGANSVGGDWSAGIGWNVIVSSPYSFVAGVDSNTSAARTFALGSGVTVTAANSVAIGNDTLVDGVHSMAFGVSNAAGARPEVSGADSVAFFMGDQSGVDITSNNVMAIMGGNVGIENAAPDVELDVTGDIEYSGTITDVSDIRMKADVKPLESSLEKVTSLEGISFTMKDDETNRTEMGFSAQDVQKVYPELIKTAEDEMGSLSMNYVGLIAPLVESVKELKAENEELKASVVALENSRHVPRDDDNEKWIYLLIGIIIGHCLLHILRHKCCSKKEG